MMAHINAQTTLSLDASVPTPAANQARHSTVDGVVRGGDVVWDVTGEGVRRQVLGRGTDLMIVRVEFETGAVGALHHHPHRQASYVARGRFDVTIGELTSELVAGDCFYVAADVVHGVRALEPGLLIDVFTPIREDFLAADSR